MSNENIIRSDGYKDNDYIYSVLDNYACNGDKLESEFTQAILRYAKTYELPDEDLMDCAKKTGDIDLAAIHIMNENNFNESLRKLPNCLDLSECDIPVNTAVATYNELLEKRKRLLMLIRYIIEEKTQITEDEPIMMGKGILYNLLLRKDTEPTTEETTLTTNERNFISSLIAIIESPRKSKIEEVLSSEQAIGLIHMTMSDDLDETIERISKNFAASGDGFISLDSRTIQVLLRLITSKKVSKAFNTELFNSIIREKFQEKEIDLTGRTLQR